MQRRPLRDHIKYTIAGLRLAGLYQESVDFFRSKYYWKYSVFVNVFFITGLNLGLTGYVLRHLDQPEIATSNAYVAINLLMPNIKAYFFVSRWFFVRNLIDQLEDADFQPKNQRQEKKCEEFFFYQHSIHVLYALLGPPIALLWAVSPFFSEDQRLPFNVWLPYDWKRPVLYELTFLHQAIAGTLTIFINIHMDLLSFGITSYIAMEFYLLSDTLSNLKEFAEDNIRAKGTNYGETNKELENVLISCIYHHKKIIRYAKDTEDFFSLLIFMQFGSSLLTLCFSMYELSTTTAFVDVLATALYQMGVSAELLYYCFFGTTIVAKSEEVARAIYETPWVESSGFFKRSVLFFMARAQRPLQLRALNFFELSLPTFAQIYRISWSFFIMLRQTQNIESKT